MTLYEIIQSFSAVTLSYTGSSTGDAINNYHFGDQFQTNKYPDKDDYYPLAYLETPFATTYNIGSTPANKGYQFALCILFKSDYDNPVTNHQKISKAERIGDIVLRRFDTLYKQQFKITSANAISLERYTDDTTCGVRINIEGVTPRESCNSIYFSS